MLDEWEVRFYKKAIRNTRSSFSKMQSLDIISPILGPTKD